MFCTECGCKIEDNFKFCPNCGMKCTGMGYQEQVKSEESVEETCEEKVDEHVDKTTDKNVGNTYSYVRKTFSKEEMDEIADSIFKTYPLERVKGVSTFQKKTNVDLETARNVMYTRYNDIKNKDIIQEEKEKRKEETRLKSKEMTERIREQEEIKSIKKMLNKNGKGCPRCHSTMISYQAKPSIMRAVLGYGIASDAGAVIGSMMGKKGYAVCMKCGKRWKI